MNRMRIAFLVIFLGTVFLGNLSPGGAPRQLTFESINFATFDQIGSLRAIDFSAISPIEDYQYWEIRYVEGLDNYTIIAKGGTERFEDLDSALKTEILLADSLDGFHWNCLPTTVLCFKYIVSVRNNMIEIWDSEQKLGDFLGPLDTREDVLLWLMAKSFFWYDDLENGAIKETGTGYEAIVHSFSLTCPANILRLWLWTSRGGKIGVIAHEIAHETGACF